jgi:hypothetical protein
MKGYIVLEFVSTKHQLAHILTKSLSKDHFCKKKHLSFIHVIDVWGVFLCVYIKENKFDEFK